MSRKLLSSYSGSFYATTGGAIDTLFDQAGSARDFVQGSAVSRPTPTTSGPNNVACAGYDGINDGMTTNTVNASSFISVSDGYMIASIYIDSFPLDQAAAHNNSIVMADNNSIVGMTVRSGNIFYAYNWDGNEDQVAGITNTATAYVVEWRHEGGNVYQRVNGAGETSIASGNSTTLANPLLLGGTASGAKPFSGKIFEAGTFSTVPNQSQRDAIMQNLGRLIGASV